jgi:hypothetical protein
MILEALRYLMEQGAKLSSAERERILVVDGRTYVTSPNGALTPLSAPLPKALLTHYPGEEQFIQIHGHRAVELVTTTIEPWKNRAVLVRAEAQVLEPEFFGCFMTVEQAMIKFQLHFAATPERDTLLRVIGNLRDEKVVTAVDDGVTQLAAVRAGVSRAGEVALPSPLLLEPYRSFADIAPIPEPFVVRLRGGGEKALPEVALFEVSNGAWKIEAARRIREFILDHLDDKERLIIS